ISSADHDRDLNAQGSDVRQFGGNLMNAKRVNAEPLGRGQGLAGKLEQNAFEDGSRHDFVAPASRRLSWGRPAHTRLKKGRHRRPQNYSAFCSGLVMSMVSPASPTLKRAKRRTAMFSPSLPIF